MRLRDGRAAQQRYARLEERDELVIIANVQHRDLLNRCSEGSGPEPTRVVIEVAEGEKREKKSKKSADLRPRHRRRTYYRSIAVKISGVRGIACFFSSEEQLIQSPSSGSRVRGSQ